MKHSFVLGVSLCLCALLLTGCELSSQPKEITADQLQLSFSESALLQVGEQQYPCKVEHSLTGQTTLTFTGSLPLEGLSLQSTQDGTVTLTYGDMTCTVGASGFPSDGVVLLGEVLNKAQSYVHLESLGNNTFSGTVGEEAFRLSADESGVLSAIETDRFSVTFSQNSQSSLASAS